MSRQMRMTTLTMLATIVATAGAQPSTEPDPRVAALAELRPLPKVHYSWPVPDAVLEQQPALLCEYARLTRAVTLSGRWYTQAQVEAAVAACKASGAQLALLFSPYHGDQTLAMIETKLAQFETALATAHGSGTDATVTVSAVLLDSEMLKARPAGGAVAAQHNQAIIDQHDAVYAACQAAYPKARIEWYRFGAVQRAHSTTGWDVSPYHVLSSEHGAYSVALYTLPHPHEMRESFRRTVQLAREHGTHAATPWVALASGYKPRNARPVWTFTWDYDTEYSWQLGREINMAWFGHRPERYAPWHAAEVVVFYPPPFDPRVPGWEKHFVAYVKGANGQPAVGDSDAGN
jgi:hypothetical protein